MSAVILGREHWYAAIARRWNRAWGDAGDEAPTIYLRQGARIGMWVVIEPACDIESLYFTTPAEARQHACDLRRLHGWPIVAEGGF